MESAAANGGRSLALVAEVQEAMGVLMPITAFISYSRSDEAFVRQLATDLDAQGIEVWVDSQAIVVGEPFARKILDGIANADYLVAVLSPQAITSEWVNREIQSALTAAREKHRPVLLPLLLHPCDVPADLDGLQRADFTGSTNYRSGLRELVTGMRVVFNPMVFERADSAVHLGSALDKAVMAGLPILAKPFHRPFQYIGQSVADVVAAMGCEPNEGGNVIVESSECRMVLWMEGNLVNYVEADLLCTAPHRQDQEFDAEAVLGAFSINPAELELLRRKTHFHMYADHRRRMQVSVFCAYDGGALAVGFGTKYYGS
jgi:hypothetical protein